MSSPFIRRSTTVAAGAVAFAGLIATPGGAFAAEPNGLASIPETAVTVSADPDGTGNLYTLTEDVRTFETITMPNDATLDGNGHTITAVEDNAHRNFLGSVLASTTGTDEATAELDIKNLDIKTEGFEGGSNSGGLLNGIYMYRAGGSLTDVSVEGISHGNGVQEGNAISIRNRVSADDINVPRAKVTLDDVDVSNYQKTGLLLDGNLVFTVKNTRIGQGAGPQGQPNPTIAANSLQISRGANGSVADSTVKLNSHESASGVLLYNARKVDFDRVNVNGDAPASTGINVSNDSNTIDTTFTMRGGEVTGTATAAESVGVYADESDAVSATVVDTSIRGWTSATGGSVTRSTTPPPAPATTRVDVTGKYAASRPQVRRLRLDLRAFKLGANEVEGKLLRWTVGVDGHRVATITQHAGDADVWAQQFRKGTGTHTVKIAKNGVSQHTYRVRTR